MEKGFTILNQDSSLFACMQEITDICPYFHTPLLHDNHKIIYTSKYEWAINGLMLRILFLLTESGLIKIETDEGKVSDTIRIHKVLDRLLTHPEDRLSMSEAAELAQMSYSNFGRTFKCLIGQNYVDYCNITRVRYAEELLLNSNQSVTEIAEKLNFGTINYFTRIFKKFNGKNPLEYRKINLQLQSHAKKDKKQAE